MVSYLDRSRHAESPVKAFVPTPTQNSGLPIAFCRHTFTRSLILNNPTEWLVSRVAIRESPSHILENREGINGCLRGGRSLTVWQK